MESSNSNSKERELQLTQRLAKQRHSICMTWFEQLETHLHDLYLLNSPYAVDAFKPAFRSFFGEEHQTFKLKMFHNLDQLRLQLERENLHGVNAKTCLQALRTQFKEFLASKGVNATDLLNQGWQQDFEDFTRCEPSAYRRELLENLDTLEAVIHRVVNTYGVLRMKENELNALKENGSQLHDEILHEHQIKSSVKMQSQDIQINPVQAMDDSLIVSKGSLIEPENNNAFSKSEIETQMQRQEEKVNMREAVDAGLVVTESSGTKPDKQNTSSSSGSYTTQAVDADIGPVNDEEPFAEVQLTALHNILANEQQHTEQSEPSYDTHLLETIESNTTPTSTNMCHRGGEIDQDALLKTELLKTKDMVDKEIYNELSKRFLQLEKHCISLEIQIQQKEESFQSNKPCKNQEFPEFREFFVINDLKAQLLARTTLICNLKKQIKSVKETSNEATVKNDIDVIETINIELEHSVAKLLAANEQLHKENEHLKQTYKELFDSIKKTKVQNKDNSESLISQINQKSVENADLKAQLQEKVFANAALKNELRKIKGNSVDTKFAKASILGKPPLQPSRNHLVVRQPNAFTSERPRISRPRFASQVDEKNDLSKTVTPHYLPKVRESAAATPHQVNAPNYSRNSHKESYGSNDMVHAYFLEDARKMTQDKTRIPSHKDMASTRAHCTPNACTPKPRNIYRSSPVSKCSGGMSNGEPLVDHSRNSSFFLDSKQLVCSICHKYIFNTNHDDCITKILNKVNSRAKVQSPKIRNNNPVEPKNHTHKPGRQNGIGQRFSLNKSSAVHEKPHTPRSCLRWKPTGRIFKTVRLRWIPTGKVFIDSTTKVDSEPPNGSNDDITNPYECNQTLYVSAGTSNSSAGTSVNPLKERLGRHGWFSKVIIYYLASNNNIHRRPDSDVHHTRDDFILVNLKFVPKGKTVEVFGMAIPDPLIIEAIQQSSYYPKYLEMVAENTKKTPQESASVQSATKLRKGKPTFQLVDEDDEAQQESVPQKEGDDPDLELAKKMSLEVHQEKGESEGADADMERAIKLSLEPAFLPQVGKGKAIVTEEQIANSLIDLSKKKRTTDQFILVRHDQAPHDSTTGPSSQTEDDTSEKVIPESSSTSDSERTKSETEAVAPKGDKDQGELDLSRVTSGVSIPVSTQGQAGLDPEKAYEALAGPDPEPMQEDQTGLDSRKAYVSFAGPNLEHMDDEFLATAYPKVHENLKLITDERVIEDNLESHSGSMSSMKNLDDTDNFGDQFLYDKPTEDDQEKSKVIEESDSTIPDPSHQTVTSTPPVIAPFIDVSSTKPSSLLRVARLEQEMSKVKKTDHSADVLALIKSQVPTVIDKYLGTKLDDALLKILERHTTDLIEKYSEQGEEKQDSTYSIRSTDKVDLEEFDLKSALFKHMNKNKTANRNPANYHLYHALMEALIADEDAMDKEVTVKVKDHKRKHDSDDDEDDDDDEGPSAGSNQGKSTKRRRHDSGASGSAQPPTKDDEQSSKKPRESDASASKQHPALTSTGWQITDTRDDVVNSLMHMLPNNIQITDTSLMHMLNLNPSPHKEDSLVLLSEIPLLCQRRGLLIRLRSSRWEADVVSEHFDRDDNAGDDNEETKPDPEEIYK
ncbi:hypothetical protein Tco_1476745 [Tanacetum coccineum]